jgi:hypothetical protein
MNLGRAALRKLTDKTSIFFLLYRLTALELLRNKLGLLLIVVIPSCFLAVVEWTSGQGVLPIKLYFSRNIDELLLNQREISLVFMSAAVGGFLMSYYAILLFQQDFEYYRYCISMRLSPWTFVASRFSFFFTLAAAMAVFLTLILRGMMNFHNIPGALAGFILLSLIYGAYGGLAGILTKDFMIAILFVVLLANIDAGWLQNPVFYSTSQETAFIKWLPAFFPCQFIFSSVFSGKINIWALLMSLVYASGFFSALLLAVQIKIKGVYHGNNHKE